MVACNLHKDNKLQDLLLDGGKHSVAKYKIFLLSPQFSCCRSSICMQFYFLLLMFYQRILLSPCKPVLTHILHHWSAAVLCRGIGRIKICTRYLIPSQSR